MTKTLISQVKSEMQIGSKYQGGTIFELFNDGSGGKLLFYVASGTFNEGYQKLEVEFINARKAIPGFSIDTLNKAEILIKNLSSKGAISIKK